ncbi:predicted Permeases of the drug/metabolite transporter (DMT) superfamily [Syntrophaceticus schinkii]|uniref:Predicted Permeases of the drug/metabolite transporter (DMT) superfamily n=1 Tax=Syntrophaceticus schinkii TaxID=499207 RepID=A0A0B7MJS3_9FIRM|nr:predicted Permeases of the drug/metabolite transporter (DMT) superfamily [Syntrophaceticus schinkii]
MAKYYLPGIAGICSGKPDLELCLDKVPAVTAGAYLYLSPVVAAIVAFIFLNEIPGLYTIAGGIIILTGTFFASK